MQGRIRIDDHEMSHAVQTEVDRIWPMLSTENVYEYSDLAGYRREFFQLFGFESGGVDYEADISPVVAIRNSSY